jgi:hypothetical protein
MPASSSRPFESAIQLFDQIRQAGLPFPNLKPFDAEHDSFGRGCQAARVTILMHPRHHPAADAKNGVPTPRLRSDRIFPVRETFIQQWTRYESATEFDGLVVFALRQGDTNLNRKDAKIEDLTTEGTENTEGSRVSKVLTPLKWKSSPHVH